MGSRKRSTGSFLPPGVTADVAQKKAAKALRTSWTKMHITAHYADADKSPDQRASNGFMDRVESTFNIFEELPTICLGFACPFPSSVCDCCEPAAAKEEDAGAEDVSAEPLDDHRDEIDEDQGHNDWNELDFNGQLALWLQSEPPIASPNEAKMYTRLGAPRIRGQARFSAVVRLSMKFA